MPYNKRESATLETALRIQARRLEGASWSDITAEFGFWRGVAKAVLEKFNLEDTPGGANYRSVEMWDRPCLKCKKTERRGKWLFLCKSCRNENRTEYNAADSMYASSDGGIVTGATKGIA